MIRFSCPDCGREYMLADALAHLPLLCRGCGLRLNVPAPNVEPQPEPEPPSKPKPEPKPAPEVVPAPRMPAPEPVAVPLPDTDGTGRPLLSPDTMADLDRLSPAPPKPLPGPQPATPPTRAGNRTALPWVVDGVVMLVLLVAGALVGEVVTKKSTGAILSGAGSAPKFPPTDLVLWLGCVACFGLVYVWLGTRGWTAGAWLRRNPA